MKYTEKDLFDFMDLGKEVRVTCTDGKIFIGRCWAYGRIVSEEEYGIDEPCLDVGGSTLLRLSEIECIEFTVGKV